MSKNKKAQSTLEYIIVFTAIVAAIIAAVSVIGQKSSGTGLGKLMKKSADKITTESGKIPLMVK